MVPLWHNGNTLNLVEQNAQVESDFMPLFVWMTNLIVVDVAVVVVIVVV